jgi:hypothetical protein
VPVTEEDRSLGSLTMSLLGHPFDEVFTVVIVGTTVVAESEMYVGPTHGFLERLSHLVILAQFLDAVYTFQFHLSHATFSF